MITRKAIFTALLVFLLSALPTFAQKNSCVECHGGLEGKLKAPADAFKQDIHGQFGLSCKDCHGGNPLMDDIGEAKDKSFRGTPKRADVPEFCAGCHSDAAYMRSFNPSLRVDQLSQYRTSQHGLLLKKGDANTAVCTDCHGVHGIQSAKFPKAMTFPWNISQTCGRCHENPEYMKTYKIPTDQFSLYRESVHHNALYEKKDLSAPTCNDCHGNHGAYPPEVASIASVCRQCHPSAGELFSKSPHKRAFDEMGISECEACHGNHKILSPSNEMLGTAENSVCIQCHETGSKGYGAASDLRELLEGFQARYQQSAELLALAEKKGVEISEPKFQLQSLNTVLVSAKNLVHGLDLGEIQKKIEEGDQVLVEVEKAGRSALNEAKFRRTGLIIATLFLTLFGIALFLKIRSMRHPD